MKIIVRALIKDNNQLLVADVGTHLFLPGGHVKHKEPIKVALKRELKEEMIVTNLSIGQFLWALENTWNDNNKVFHEYLMIFKVYSPELNTSTKIHSKEPHLKFHWVKLEELKFLNFLPKSMLDFLT